MKKEPTKSLEILKIDLRSACQEFNRKLRTGRIYYSDNGDFVISNIENEGLSVLDLFNIIQELKQEIKELEND